MAAIPIPADKIAEFCRRHHIRKMALFGSVLTDEFRPDSDVDVLVEFEPGHSVGFKFISIQREMSAVFQGRPVDLFTEESLHPLIRNRVTRQAQVVYAA
jgi:predicted nucleotidyltransferase